MVASEDTSQHVTAAVCPSSVFSISPVSTSHTFRVSSELPVTIHESVGESAQHLTHPVCLGEKERERERERGGGREGEKEGEEREKGWERARRRERKEKERQRERERERERERQMKM